MKALEKHDSCFPNDDDEYILVTIRGEPQQIVSGRILSYAPAGIFVDKAQNHIGRVNPTLPLMPNFHPLPGRGKLFIPYHVIDGPVQYLDEPDEKPRAKKATKKGKFTD